MIVQVYKNKESGQILLHSKTRKFDKENNAGYEFVEEFEGETWQECQKKINEKYFPTKKR